LDLLRRDERTGCYVWEPLAWVTVMSSLRALMAPVDGVGIVLKELANAAGATVLLSYPTPNLRRMGICAFARPDRGVSLDPVAWMVAPMHCSAAGKAYLSAKPAAELAQWARAGLPPATGKSITRPELLLSELARAREHGFATAWGECVAGVVEVGVPVRDDKGNALAGLQVCAAREAADASSPRRWAELLPPAATRLSAVLYGLGPGDSYWDRRPEGPPDDKRGASPSTPPPRRRPYRSI
jgi:DNA-binding IclR family transcriptional regulator